MDSTAGYIPCPPHTPHTPTPPSLHTHTEVIEELQTELVKAEQEQRSYASRLHSAEGQLETLSMSHQQLSAEMDEKCARLKQVETQRNGVQERLKHMDAQVHACTIVPLSTIMPPILHVSTLSTIMPPHPPC